MKLKKILAAALAAAMVMSSAIVASAGYYDSSSVAEPDYVMGADAEISVAGIPMKTSVAGAYAAKSVQGTVVVTPLATVRANLGLTGSQVPAITIWDTDPKKSPKAL